MRQSRTWKHSVENHHLTEEEYWDVQLEVEEQLEESCTK